MLTVCYGGSWQCVVMDDADNVLWWIVLIMCCDESWQCVVMDHDSVLQWIMTVCYDGSWQCVVMNHDSVLWWIMTVCCIGSLQCVMMDHDSVLRWIMTVCCDGSWQWMMLTVYHNGCFSGPSLTWRVSTWMNQRCGLRSPLAGCVFSSTCGHWRRHWFSVTETSPRGRHLR